MTSGAENRPRAVLVASHPRSGTHLAMDLMRRQFASLRSWRWFGLPLDHLYLNLERLEAESRRFSERKARKIVNRPQRALMKTHFTAGFKSGWAQGEDHPPSQEWRDFAHKAQVIYVIRHPMDVMVSYKQFLSALDPDIARQDFDAFLRSSHWDGSSDRLAWWQAHVRGWSGQAGVEVLRYEDIVKQTAHTVDTIARVLQEAPLGRMPLLPAKVTTRFQTRLSRLFELAPQSTAIIADRRRFPAVDWRASLSGDLRAELEERLQPELARFGYDLKERAE